MRKKLDMAKPTNKKILDSLTVIQKIFQDRAITFPDANNFRGTADRVARMYEEMYWPKEKIAEELMESLHTTFPVNLSDNNNDREAGMITHGPVIINSMCPHHLMPVRYSAYLAYIPVIGGKVLGVSKLDRIPIVLAKRFILQEQLAKDIADILYNPAQMKLLEDYHLKDDKEFEFETEGAIVTLVGIHTCSACRGIQQDARTMVTERRGAFKEASIEQRFYTQIEILDKIRPFGF